MNIGKRLELWERSELEICWGTVVFRGLLEEAGPARDRTEVKSKGGKIR